jgi:hypothetical protein
MLTVDTVLTVLAEHYSFPMDSSKPLQHGDVDWTKQPRANLLELRMMILEILRAICSKGISLAEMKSIVAYLQEEHQKVFSITSCERCL